MDDEVQIGNFNKLENTQVQKKELLEMKFNIVEYTLQKEKLVLDYLCNYEGVEEIRIALEELQNQFYNQEIELTEKMCSAMQKGLEVFRKTMMMQSPKIMNDCEFFRIYYNSITRSRLRDEYAKISFTSIRRK